MKSVILQDEINEFIDHIIYLQMMASFAPDIDFGKVEAIAISMYKFIETSDEEMIKNKLPELKKVMSKMISPITKRFPLKRELRNIITDFNDFIKTGNDVYSYGVEYGWLNAQMDLKNLRLYKDIPYHYRIGLAGHKGNGSIEEDFLLNDAFSVRVKAEYYQNLLLDYLKKLDQGEKVEKPKEFSNGLYQQVSDIKFEVAAYSRITVISFYAFVESFVNSVGHNHILNNINILGEMEKELLSGFKNGRFLQLKSKIEKFQTLIRPDKKAKIIVSDDQQIPENFKHFFDYYEQLRNSAMHYSPMKEKIWMSPHDWIEKAIEFSKLSLEISLEFWKSCYPESEGPEYLGKLDHNLHLDRARKRSEKIRQIDINRKNLS